MKYIIDKKQTDIADSCLRTFYIHHNSYAGIIKSRQLINFNFNSLQDVRLAKQFEGLVKLDNRFELVQEATMGLVCFRLKVNVLV